MYETLKAELRSMCCLYGDECLNCNPYGHCRSKMEHKAADAIDKLIQICNSLLSKYEEAAEAMIYEYSVHIDEDLDELHKEIKDYKAQINGGTESPKEET